MSVSSELGMEGDEVLMVSVGNLCPVKGHRFLVEGLGVIEGTALKARDPRERSGGADAPRHDRRP
jgi:hypothetical protein